MSHVVAGEGWTLMDITAWWSADVVGGADGVVDDVVEVPIFI